MKPILLIDGMNIFVRSWAAFPQMSTHGYQIGGCVGFLKTLQRLVRELSPSAVYVAWEGGGSQRRRKLFPEYKMNKRPERLNRFYGEDIPDTEDNKKHQLLALLNMLRQIPVCQVYVDNCEGDDIIAFLCTGPFRSIDKIIVSSDKDMFQLLNDKTRIYSAHKKRIVTSEDVFNEYKIHVNNFALAKSLCGDTSDNIPGVKGVGYKTVSSKFPFLGKEDTVILQDLFNYAASHTSESVIYKRIYEEVNLVRRNWDLVHLDGSMLSADQISKLQNVLDTFVPKANRIELIRALMKEGINDFDVDRFFYDFLSVEGLNNIARTQHD